MTDKMWIKEIKQRIKSAPVIYIIIAVLLIVLIFRLLTNFSDNRRQMAIKSGEWDKLMLVLSQIDGNYVDSIDRKSITEEIIPVLLRKLDPHSLYLPPAELKDADEALEGNFDGIGVQFNVPNDTAVIISVITGGPSERAGILSGDRIVQVNSEVVAGVKMHQDSLVKRLRGASGSTVKVGIKRGGAKELVHFDIKRDKIPVKSVDVGYMVDDSTGYIKLSKFSKTSHEEFLSALKSLAAQGMKKLIFDLRGNSGGYFDQSLLLSNEFLEKGQLIVYMQGMKRKRQDFHANGKGIARDIELKVLIDEGSASSSEIFAGAIQDNDRGTIIGRRSFGKGLVQEPIYFSDKSGLRLTVARFYTPTGRSIQKPYSDDYRYDILERYRHGEMTSADSIRKNDSLKYITPGGKTVYGGGGIIPDIFVPLDTMGVNKFFVNASNMGLPFKYSSTLADRYRRELNEIKDIASLYKLMESINIEDGFLKFAAFNKLVPEKREWEESREVIISQIKALFGRYSVLDDLAFYPIIAGIDNVMTEAVGK